MRKLLLIIVAFLAMSATIWGQEIKMEKNYSQKFFSIKAGVSTSSALYYEPRIMVGPDIGIAWEKWYTTRRGFTTEVHLAFPQNYGIPYYSIQGIGYVSVPILWTYAMGKKWAFKTGVQPNIIFYTVKETGKGATPTIFPDVQLPLCFSYHPTKRFSLDLKLSLGIIEALINVPTAYIFGIILPVHTSLSINAGWKFFKE